LDEKLTN
jgi:hypothetical protein